MVVPPVLFTPRKKRCRKHHEITSSFYFGVKIGVRRTHAEIFFLNRRKLTPNRTFSHALARTFIQSQFNVIAI